MKKKCFEYLVLTYVLVSGGVFAQSICTHYFSFKKLGGFADLKKNWVGLRTWKKQGAKKQGLDFCFVVVFIQKEKRRPGLLF